MPADRPVKYMAHSKRMKDVLFLKFLSPIKLMRNQASWAVRKDENRKYQ